MSDSSVASKLCQDQLALAYVSKKNIFPVQLNEREDLLAHMDNGMYVHVYLCESVCQSVFIKCLIFNDCHEGILAIAKYFQS